MPDLENWNERARKLRLNIIMDILLTKWFPTNERGNIDKFQLRKVSFKVFVVEKIVSKDQINTLFFFI